MKPVTNIADLRDLARRRVPRAFFEYADRGAYDESTLRENRSAFERLRFRQRVMRDVDNRSLAYHGDGPGAEHATGHRAYRSHRTAIRQRRDPRRTCRREGRHTVLPQHDVDLFHRAGARRHGRAVLVPGLRDARPRLHPRTHPPCAYRGMFGADAHRRPDRAGAAPPRDQERLVRAAEDHPAQPVRHREQAALGVERAACAEPVVRQPRWAYPGRGQPDHAGAMDRQPVRSDAELERPGVDSRSLARQAHPQGHPRRRGRPPGRRPWRGRHRRIQPRRAPAGRRTGQHRRPAVHRGRGRRRHRGLARQWHHEWAGPAQGARTGCARRVDRQGLPL